MFTVYAFSTPNSLKVPLALEALGLDYELKSINVRQGEQKTPAYLAINPNGKVPVLLDHERGLTIAESAAILVHLAEVTGKLLPSDAAGRARVFEQLFFHAAGLSPAFGNAGWFQKFAPEPIPVAIERFLGEATRLVSLLDDQLAESAFVAGDDLSIADLAHFGWLWRRDFVGVTLDGAPNVARWYDAIESQPFAQKAIARTEALAQPTVETV